MKFNIRGDKVKVTAAIKNYTEEKISRINKYFRDHENTTANVLIRVKGIEQIVEVTINADKMLLRAEESHRDLYAAIDLVSEKIERQIIKNKTRIKKNHNKNYDLGINFNIENENIDEDNSIIVKRKEIEMKPMNEEEAILQMNLLGHEFFIFKDVETMEVCVLYKRKDGNYGIISTK